MLYVHLVISNFIHSEIQPKEKYSLKSTLMDRVP